MWRLSRFSFIVQVAILLCLLEKSAWSRIEKVNYRQKEKQVLDDILGKGYDKRIRPSGKNDTDGPATINVNIYLRTISRIDDVKMEYSVQVTFREQWNDERLRYHDDTQGRLKYLTLTDPTKVWMPDTFFRNEKEARKHEIIVPNVYVRIFPDGEILYSIRISLTLACPMDLRLYPLDKQVCVLQIASYGWAKDDLIYQWKQKDPVQVVPNLHLPRFTLEQYKSAYCDVITNTGKYSCLKVELIFKREFSYYMLTIYVPCCMLVIVSWVSFWLDQNAIPARVSLGVTTLLTMSTQTSGINAQLPPVSYTKAIDVWTGVCQCFVFCALLEFALVNYASRSDMQRDRARERNERARRQWELEHADMQQVPPGSGPPGMTPSGSATPRNNGPTTLNHIGSSDTIDGIPGFSLKKRTESRNLIREPEEYRPAHHQTTTPYPHPHPQSPDLGGFMQSSSSMSDPYMLSGNIAEVHGGGCEIHMNSFPSSGAAMGIAPAGGAIPLHYGQGQKLPYGLNWLRPVIFCCTTQSLLSRFPSRAKRIDVISRVIFPMVFAIFNLAYWLYYLFAKSKSPQQED